MLSIIRYVQSDGKPRTWRNVTCACGMCKKDVPTWFQDGGHGESNLVMGMTSDIFLKIETQEISDYACENGVVRAFCSFIPCRIDLV